MTADDILLQATHRAIIVALGPRKGHRFLLALAEDLGQQRKRAQVQAIDQPSDDFRAQRDAITAAADKVAEYVPELLMLTQRAR